MITANFTIRFNLPVDAARLNIMLDADVQEHHSETFYTATNFRLTGHSDRHVLPDIAIRKQDGHWVHTDSGQPTDLSEAVGAAIEAKPHTGDLITITYTQAQ